MNNLFTKIFIAASSLLLLLIPLWWAEKVFSEAWFVRSLWISAGMLYQLICSWVSDKIIVSENKKDEIK